MPEAAKVAQQDAKSVVFYLVKDHWSQSWSITTGHQQSVGALRLKHVLCRSGLVPIAEAPFLCKMGNCAINMKTFYVLRELIPWSVQPY